MVRFKHIIIKLHCSVSYRSFTTVQVVYVVVKVWMGNLHQNHHRTNTSVNVQNYSTTSILNFITTVPINRTPVLPFAFVTSNNESGCHSTLRECGWVFAPCQTNIAPLAVSSRTSDALLRNWRTEQGTSTRTPSCGSSPRLMYNRQVPTDMTT